MWAKLKERLGLSKPQPAGEKTSFTEGIGLPIREKTLEEVLQEMELTLLESDVALEVIEAIQGEVRTSLKGKKLKWGEDASQAIESALRKAVLNVLNLKPFDLEEAIIRTLRDYGIEGCRDRSHPGVWVEGEEIAAIGLSVKCWITMHGIAINVNPNMEHFSLINPCGFSDRKATSMTALLGRDISMEEMMHKFVDRFAEVFRVDMEWGSSLPTEAVL